MKDFVASIPFGKGVNILKYEFGLIAVDKPEGMLCHPNKPGVAKRCLVQAEFNFEEECFEWSKEDGSISRVYLLNRLDSPTSGLVLLATELAVAKQVREAYRLKRVYKKYYAIVCGRINGREGQWHDHLKRTRSEEGKLRVQGGEGLEVSTAFKLVKSSKRYPQLKMIEMNPLTGRTHQLRVQTAMRQCPILGDQTYGDFKLNKQIEKMAGCKRLFLHANRMELTLGNPPNRKVFHVESSLPESFEALM